MRLDHEFNGVRDVFPRGKRVPHAFMSHRDPVADAYRVELKRRAASCRNSLSDAFGDHAKMRMARNDRVPGVGDPDKGFVHLFIRYPK